MLVDRVAFTILVEMTVLYSSLKASALLRMTRETCWLRFYCPKDQFYTKLAKTWTTSGELTYHRVQYSNKYFCDYKSIEDS